LHQSILPGHEHFPPSSKDEQPDDLCQMMADLLSQIDATHIRYLAAAATHDLDQAWAQFHEKFALEKDLWTVLQLRAALPTGHMRIAQ
jgi:hypothetical protein